jgi:hypothetical protein
MSDVEATPYPDVNRIVGRLHDGAQAILREQFVGMYLDGSLALGEFNDDSDIDFLIATTESITQMQFDALYALHEGIRRSGLRYSADMEGSYIPVAYLRKHDPNAPDHPNLQRGDQERLRWQHHYTDWVIHRHVLYHHGIIVSGTSPKTLIDPVSADELRSAVKQLILDWWEPIAHQPDRLAFDGYKAYAVVSMCRMLYTLEHGDVVSKPAAARWARSINGAIWADLIDRALVYRLTNDDLQQTLDLMRYTIEKSQYV